MISSLHCVFSLCAKTLQVGDDKEERTAVHMAIKQLSLKLTSSTCWLEDGSRAIKVTRSKFADGQSVGLQTLMPLNTVHTDTLCCLYIVAIN